MAVPGLNSSERRGERASEGASEAAERRPRLVDPAAADALLEDGVGHLCGARARVTLGWCRCENDFTARGQARELRRAHGAAGQTRPHGPALVLAPSEIACACHAGDRLRGRRGAVACRDDAENGALAWLEHLAPSGVIDHARCGRMVAVLAACVSQCFFVGMGFIFLKQKREGGLRLCLERGVSAVSVIRCVGV